MATANFIENYGPWAIVTGASSGIGVSFAKLLAEKGLNIVLIARREDRLKKLAEQLERDYQVATRVIAIDLAREDFLERLKPQLADLEIGMLINNAGFATSGNFLSNTVEDELKMLNLNCRAPLLLSHTYGKKMLERKRGGIIFVASTAAFMGIPSMSHYAATKSYDLLLGEGLSHELRKEGVDVLAVCPGETNTEFHDVATLKKVMPMNPDRVVEIALKRLSHRSAVTTGIMNVTMIAFTRFLPRSLVSKIAGGIMNKARLST